MTTWAWAAWRAGLLASVLSVVGADLAHAQMTLESNGRIRMTGSWHVSAGFPGGDDVEDYTFFAVRSTGETRNELENAPFLLVHDPPADVWFLDVLSSATVPGDLCPTRAACPPAIWQTLSCPTNDLCILFLEESQPDPGEPIDDAEVHFVRACAPVVNPVRSTNVAATGGAGLFAVSIAQHCDWTAAKDDPAWPVIVSPPSAHGPFSVNYVIGPNLTGVRQTYTITVAAVGGAPAVFTIEQLAATALNWSYHDGPDFGEVIINTLSRRKTVSVTNVGSVPITLSRIEDCPDKRFRVHFNQNAPPFTLAPTQTTSYGVEFNPLSLGLLTCVISAPEDPGAGLIVSGTGVVTRAPFSVSLNGSAYSPGQTMMLTAALAPLSGTGPVDAYVVLRLPNGQLLSLQLGGGLVSGIVPIARAFVPFDLEALLVQYMFTGGEPRGTYTWYTVLTQPGTLNFVSPLKETTFTLP